MDRKEILQNALEANDMIAYGLAYTRKGKGLYFVKSDGESNHDFVYRTFFEDDPYMDKCRFDVLYRQAVGGDGHEDGNMGKVNSSALLPLLFFAHVSRAFPLKVGGVCYTQVAYEFKNRTLRGASDFGPSNIDVVLTDEGCRHVLFIESKFGEYYYDVVEVSDSYAKSKKGDGNMTSKEKRGAISAQYRDVDPSKSILNALLAENTWLQEVQGKDNAYLICRDVGADGQTKMRYYDGVMQMIKHVSGIGNYRCGRIHGENCLEAQDAVKREIAAHHGSTSVALAEILFDFAAFGDFASEALADYRALHADLCAATEGLSFGLETLPLVTYQEIARANPDYIAHLPSIVCALYRMNQ